jgi:hypothetical protein
MCRDFAEYELIKKWPKKKDEVKTTLRPVMMSKNFKRSKWDV